MKICGLLNCVMKLLIGFLNPAVQYKKKTFIYCWKDELTTDFMQAYLPSPVSSVSLLSPLTRIHIHIKLTEQRWRERRKKRKATLCDKLFTAEGRMKKMEQPWPVWLTWLGIFSQNQIATWIPGQGTCLGCRFSPQWGYIQKQPIDVSFLSLPSPLSKNKIKSLK